jgi:D-glycerate 3-kinase
MTEGIVDDKSEHCIPFILEKIDAHRNSHTKEEGKHVPPFFLGLNGIQGAGKTTLVSDGFFSIIIVIPSHCHSTQL